MLSSLMLVGGNWFIDFLKTVTHVIDQGIYFLVQAAYQVFYFIANATILNETIVENFTLRMYTLIGIVMVFVLAFNLLNYIVDPDKITDKKVGASSFVKDVILAIAIISLSPMLFTKLYSLQSAILTSGVIENLILGGASGADVMSEDEWNNNQGKYKSYAEYMIANGGNSMVASVYVAFLYPTDGTFTALDCDPVNPSNNGKYNDYCLAYKTVKEGGSLKVFDPYITNDDYNFTPLLTTVAGVVLLFFMLSFCINLAKRVGKMAILQLIAPVPVTLELLPNKKGLRDNWLKTLGKVYIEVFFYMAVMFLVMLLISLVPGTIQTLLGNGGSGYIGISGGAVKLFATVLLIYGLLMFGKEAPQMLFDLLGIKSTGVIKEALQRGIKMAGATTAGLGAGATTMLRNGYGAIDSFRNGRVGEGFGRLGGIVTGGVGGFARGMRSNWSGGIRGIRRGAASGANETLSRQQRARDRFGRFTDQVSQNGLGDTIFENIRTSATDAVHDAQHWFSGENSASRESERITAMNAAKGYFKNVTKGFAQYEDATKKLNDEKFKSGYTTALNAWLAQPANAGKKEKDFIDEIRRTGDPRFTNVINAIDQQEAIKTNRINSQQNEIITSALGMLQYIDANPQIGLSADARAKRDALRALIDDNGQIAAGKSIQDVYKTLSGLNSQLDTDVTTATRVVNSQRITEEARRRNRGGNNNNNNSGGGGH